MKTYAPYLKAFAVAFILTTWVLLLISSLSTATYKRIDVVETCEQPHTFMHDGKRYYCAPWVPLEDEEAPATPRTEGDVHA
jgi:hypothetical protein